MANDDKLSGTDNLRAVANHRLVALLNDAAFALERHAPGGVIAAGLCEAANDLREALNANTRPASNTSETWVMALAEFADIGDYRNLDDGYPIMVWESAGADTKIAKLTVGDARKARTALVKAVPVASNVWHEASEPPSDGETVIGYWRFRSVPSYESLTYHAKDAPDSRAQWRDAFGDEADPPSYWMPLPTPPVETRPVAGKEST